MAVSARELAFFAQPIHIAGGRAIAAPFQFATTGEDSLRLIVINAGIAVRVKVQGRRVDEKGAILPLAHTLTAQADRTPTSQDYPLGIGALVNLSVHAEPVQSGLEVFEQPVIGQTFVTLQIIRGLSGGTEVLGVLLQGYVTQRQGLGWPGSPIEDSLRGQGVLRQIIGTAPAAGADISESVPTNARWRLVSVFATLQTLAAPGNRLPYIRVEDEPAFVFWRLYSAAAQASGLTRAHQWFIGVNQATAIDPVYQQSALPHGTVLKDGGRFVISAVGMAVDDQWAAPRYIVEEWLEAR